MIFPRGKCTLCERPALARGLCNGHYKRSRNGGGNSPIKQYMTSEKTAEGRFWLRVEKTDGCWGWTGARHIGGYGEFAFGGKVYRAHRFSYELHFGPIPEGFFVCHHCDNPICTRPDHLFAGRPGDNVRDMVAKGRHVSSEKARKASAERMRQQWADPHFRSRTIGAGAAGMKRKAERCRQEANDAALLAEAEWDRRFEEDERVLAMLDGGAARC